MEDIEKAYKIAEKKAGELGLFRADLDKAKALLKDYGEKRDNLLKGMVAMLEKSDEENLDEEWKECCSNGKEALSTLNDAMPPEGGEGLSGVGLDAFHRCELKTWDENAKAAVALAAQEMVTLHLIHAALIEECRTSLAEVKDDDAVLQEAVRGIFPTITGFLKDTLVSVGQLVMKARNPGQYGGVQDLYDQTVGFFAKTGKDIYEDARKKAALKRKLNGQIKRVEQTKTDMGEWKISQTYDEAVKAIETLQDCRDGDYEGIDWKEFGDGCKEALQKKRDEGIDQSKELFEGLYSDLRDQAKLSGQTLYNDSSQLDAWMNEIDQLFQNVDGAIDAQEAIAESLAEGPVQQAAREMLSRVRDMVKVSVDQFKETKETSQKEIDEE